jgi:hypothetical protein
MNYEAALARSLKFLVLDEIKPEITKKITTEKLQSRPSLAPALSNTTNGKPLMPPRLLELRAKLQRQKLKSTPQTTLPPPNRSKITTTLTMKTSVGSIEPKSKPRTKLHTRPFRV